MAAAAKPDQVNESIEGLKSPDAHVRFKAAIALGQSKDPRAVEPLIAALKDSDPLVRMQAAGALGKLGAPAVEPLIAALKDADPNRRYAAEALGDIKDPRGVEPLIAALKDADGWVRRDAAEALGKLKDTRAIEPLIAGLNDTTPTFEFGQFRRLAKEALVSVGGPAIEPLIAALKDADWQVRRNAAMVLGEILGGIKDDRAVVCLLAGLREHDNGVIAGAFRFFIRRAEPGSEDALIQALNAKGDDDMAVVFLNSGNSDLETAGYKWASEHGYRINSLPVRSTGSTVHWGSRP